MTNLVINCSTIFLFYYTLFYINILHNPFNQLSTIVDLSQCQVFTLPEVLNIVSAIQLVATNDRKMFNAIIILEKIFMLLFKLIYNVHILPVFF